MYAKTELLEITSVLPATSSSSPFLPHSFSSSSRKASIKNHHVFGTSRHSPFSNKYIYVHYIMKHHIHRANSCTRLISNAAEEDDLQHICSYGQKLHNPNTRHEVSNFSLICQFSLLLHGTILPTNKPCMLSYPKGLIHLWFCTSSWLCVCVHYCFLHSLHVRCPSILIQITTRAMTRLRLEMVFLQGNGANRRSIMWRTRRGEWRIYTFHEDFQLEINTRLGDVRVGH